MWKLPRFVECLFCCSLLMGIYGLTFERCPSVFCSFYLTTHFLILEGNLTGCERKQTKDGEKREARANGHSLFREKWEEEAAFLLKISEQKVLRSRSFPYCVGQYNKAVSRHPYCVWKLPYCIYEQPYWTSYSNRTRPMSNLLQVGFQTILRAIDCEYFW